MGEIVAAAAGVHAPQLLSRPPFEDPAMLQASIDALGDFGEQLDRTRAELLVIIGTDHLETFWLEAVPPFLLVVSEEVNARYSTFSGTATGHPAYAEALLRGAIDRVAILASGGMSHFPGTERYYRSFTLRGLTAGPGC